MKKPFKPGEELISLNEELHTEFSIQELEQRLETDPLMMLTMLRDMGCSLEACGAAESTLNYCENNYCSTADALQVVLCEIKYKDGDLDICSPICNNII